LVTRLEKAPIPEFEYNIPAPKMKEELTSYGLLSNCSPEELAERTKIVRRRRAEEEMALLQMPAEEFKDLVREREDSLQIGGLKSKLIERLAMSFVAMRSEDLGLMVQKKSKLVDGLQQWIAAGQRARRELKIEGFVAMKKGSPLHERIELLYPAAKDSPEPKAKVSKAAKAKVSKAKLAAKAKAKAKAVPKAAGNSKRK